jgi:hypothetical protein
MRTLAISVSIVGMLSFAPTTGEAQAGDFLKQHLNSIGTEQARAAVKSRAVEGSLKFTLLDRNSGAQDGKEVFISEDNKSVTLLKLPNPNYHGERFVCDGKNKIEVAYVKPGTYSNLGAFVEVHQEILKEGLFGGTLSTGWALTRLEQNHPKLQDQGIKKINGKELHRVQYLPAKRSDLEIFLYFDPQTSRHVMTSYSLTVAPGLGSTELETAKQDFTRYHLEERFEDFKEVDGLQLPNKWTIQFTSDVPTDPNHPRLGGAESSVSQFQATVTAVHNNISLDPKNFEIR